MVEGIYIHIPFCSEKCPYCDFTSISLIDNEIFKKYIDSLKKEFDLYKETEFSLSSIYFGGGTPSILPSGMIGEIIEYITKSIDIKTLEITIEVNPETYRIEEFKALKEYGVNRISIGAQSMIEKNLKVLGRSHSPEDTLKTVEDALNAGFENISLDMIYGIQDQTERDIKEDVKIYTSLPVKHISAYMLTAYEETPLGQMVKRGEYQMPDDDTLLKFFKVIDEAFNEKGFRRYEISNWAKDGYVCRHNLLYWRRKEFLGLGVSAWSYIKNRRFGNTKNLSEYMKKVKKGIKPVVFEEKIDEKEERKEKIFLGLRLSEGIELKLIEDKMDFVKEIVNQNLAKIEDNRLYLTPEGIMVSNYISSCLI